MTIIQRLQLFAIFIFSGYLVISQEINFEILIEKENTQVSAGESIQDKFSNIICPVTYLQFENDTLKYRYSRIFTITLEGDTSSILFIKTDTLFSINLITEIESENGGYLLWGQYYYAPTGGTEQKEVFIRTDYSFNIIWEKIFDFGFNYAAPGRKVLQNKMDDFLIACSPDGWFDMYLLRLSATGDSLDFNYFSGDSAGSVQSLTFNFDSSAYFVHTYGSHNQPGASLNRLVEVNTNLEQVNIIKYPEWYDWSYETRLWAENSFVSAGDEIVISGGEAHQYFTAYILDDELGIKKMKRLTSPDTTSTSAWYRNMDVVGDSYIYLGGSFNGFYHSSNDTSWYYLAMLYENLDLIYEKYIGGDKHYWCECITATEDGGVFLSGVVFEVNTNPIFHKAYLLKFDTTGIPVSIKKPTYLKINDALLFPNPGKEYLNIKTSVKEGWIEIYNLNGKLMLERKLDNNLTTISTDQLSIGTYLYIIRNNNYKVQSGKWIKQN